MNKTVPRRLVCLPAAGGSAASFAAWRRSFAADIELVFLEPPGRGSRFGEPLQHRLEPVIDDAVARIRALEPPVSLFGHSMGGTVAYEVARRLTAAGGAQAIHHLIIAASLPPHVERPLTLHELDDAALGDRLVQMGGIPAELQKEAEMLQLFVPIIRADLTACERWTSPAGLPLDCPMTVLGGDSDPMVPVQALARWCDLGVPQTRVTVLPGGHFFVHSALPLVTRLVTDILLG